MLYAKNSLLIMEESLPPGFRFHPTDEELITYYLSRKVSDYGFITRAIVDVDLNKCEPWDLPGKASMGEREWYFFSLRDRKYPTGLRTNRATDAGYWKTTGKDKEIFQSGVFVGMKKTLVFYMGRAPKGEKTNWVMHEYRHQTKFPYKPSKEEWVVCRVFKKSSSGKKPESMTPSMPPLLESPCNTPLSEIGEIDASMLNNIVNSSGSLNGMQTNDTSINGNNNIDVSMYMNWREETTPTSLPWPSNFLVSNYSSNPDTLKALLFNGYQPREATNITSLNSFVGQVDPIFGAESKLNVAESSSRGTDSIQQQQFDQASVWRGYEC